MDCVVEVVVVVVVEAVAVAVAVKKVKIVLLLKELEVEMMIRTFQASEVLPSNTVKQKNNNISFKNKHDQNSQHREYNKFKIVSTVRIQSINLLFFILVSLDYYFQTF